MMFWNKKTDTNPLGVPLGDLMAMLQPTSLTTVLKGNVLTARHEHFTTRVEVVPPEDRESENGPIRAVVRVVTELPAPVQAMLRGNEPDGCAAYNAFAALGAVCADGGTAFVGSRLTIYEEEDAWRTLQLPLLLFSTIGATDAILGGFRRAMAGDRGRGGASRWTERDLAQVEGYLSRLSLCTTGGLGLTAEFGLKQGAVSAAAGDHRTALFQLRADQPHPEFGGGLFCLIEMPHQAADADRLAQVCLQLNRMEMAAHDLPPHFGAWCPGRLSNNPAYVCFLPNAVRDVSGIAVNVSLWAFNRAQWANAMLPALGVSS